MKVLLTTLLALAATAQAATITIGGNDANNVFPFSFYGAGHEYQQFYLLGLVSPVVITDLAFASKVDLYSSPYQVDVTIGLGSATGTTTNYAANRGVDFQTVYSGTSLFSPDGHGPANDGFDLNFHLTNPFVFDPALTGILLMDVRVNNSLSAFVGFHAGNDDFRSWRVYDSSGTGPTAIDSLSLLTKITTNQAPEPGTFPLMIGAGLAALGFCTRRKTAR
jgi:PEP-CTERM motif